MSLFPVRDNRSQAKTSPKVRNTFVPRLEVLESRDLLSTFTVTTASGDPNTSGSLPWAINQSNNTPGQNTINFNIGSGGAQVINLSGVQYINNTVTIDGTTQPGYNGTPLISVQGSGSSISTLFFINSSQTNSSGSVIQGLDMYNFTANAVTLIAGSTNDTIQNDWIGFYVDPSGGVHLNSGLGYQTTSGIGIQTNSNAIRNDVISGVYNGIAVGENAPGNWSGKVYSGNTIAGNYIGTNPAGTSSAGYGNQSSAVFLGLGSQGNAIVNNVMSGNVHGGELLGPSCQGNLFQGNKIGTDVTGNHAIPNSSSGFDVTNSANGNTIRGNIISGNSLVGLNLGVPAFGAAFNNTVVGNVIGLNAGQTGAIGTGTYGVLLNAGSTGNVIQGNVICGAAQVGVYLQAASSNNVTNNWIGESSGGTSFGNGLLGIAATANSGGNTLGPNFFGANPNGDFYVDPSSTSSAVTTALNLLGVLIQDFFSGNIAGLFNSLDNLIALLPYI